MRLLLLAQENGAPRECRLAARRLRRCPRRSPAPGGGRNSRWALRQAPAVLPPLAARLGAPEWGFYPKASLILRYEEIRFALYPLPASIR
ncbi:MAG: hypothetical protein LBH14_02790, partial [Desulfobulbaceae bacterium]|nr:hypothetical protein [Desulfobulbaceae bacterium]